MKKCLTLLLLTALLTIDRWSSVNNAGTQQASAYSESFTPEEAEEPVAFRRRQDGGSTEAAGCAGRCVAKKRQILYGVTDSVTLALVVERACSRFLAPSGLYLFSSLGYRNVYFSSETPSSCSSNLVICNALSTKTTPANHNVQIKVCTKATRLLLAH